MSFDAAAVVGNWDQQWRWRIPIRSVDDWDESVCSPVVLLKFLLQNKDNDDKCHPVVPCHQSPCPYFQLMLHYSEGIHVEYY